MSDKSFAVREMNGWNKLPEEVAEIEAAHESKGKQDNVRPQVFADDNGRIFAEQVVGRKLPHNVFALKVPQM